MIYLDNAATSAVKPFVVHLRHFYESIFTSVNAGRGAHRKSIRALNGINKTAEKISNLFNIDNPSSIAFLPNATYALNLAISGVVNQGEHIITTEMDHNSVLRPTAQKGNYTIVKADKNGYVHPKSIEEAITPQTKLIVCTHISNVCGSIQPVEKISQIAKKHNVLFLLDASQSAGCVTVDAQKIGADMIAFSGHKGLLGPLGTGGLYVSDTVKLNPVISGGTGSLSESIVQPDFMPDMLQSGTLNTPGIIALGTAIDCLLPIDETHRREKQMAKRFIDDILNMKNTTVYGTKTGDRNGTVSFNIDGIDPAVVEEQLDREYNIIVRAGYHCSPLAHKALGSYPKGSVRVSFGYFNNDYDRMAITDAIYRISKQIRV